MDAILARWPSRATALRLGQRRAAGSLSRRAFLLRRVRWAGDGTSPVVFSSVVSAPSRAERPVFAGPPATPTPAGKLAGRASFRRAGTRSLFPATFGRRLNGRTSGREIDILRKRVFAHPPKSRVFGTRIVDSDAPGTIGGPNVKMGKAKRATF